MNNKSIEKTSITRRTHRFIYMLTGILLLLSCGSDNNNPTEDPGNTTNYYLQLQPNGLNAIRVSCTEENFVFDEETLLHVCEVMKLTEDEKTELLDAAKKIRGV